jgi:hypothetical protein
MKKKKTAVKTKKKTAKRQKVRASWLKPVLISLLVLFVVFVGIRLYNGRISGPIASDIKASQALAVKDPLLGNYQLAVDHLRAGRVFKTVSHLKKLNDVAKNKKMDTNQVVAWGSAYYADLLNRSDSPANLYYYLFVKIAQKKYGQAYQLTDVLIDRNASDDFAYALKGYIQSLYFNQTSQAIRHIEKAVSLNSKSPIYHYMLYQGYKSLGQNDLAAAEMKKLIGCALLGY